MTRRLIIALFALTAALVSSAQEVEWSVDANVVFNNREGGLDESPNQTFIFTRITPQIGVSFDSARHRLMGGVTWFQPMNDNLGGYKVQPALYYQYRNDRRGLSFKFGVIPNELNNTVPTYLRSDSLNYVQPNIKGAALRIDRQHFWFNSWFDWRQMQTNNRREAFDVTGEVGWRECRCAHDCRPRPGCRQQVACSGRFHRQVVGQLEVALVDREHLCRQATDAPI